MDENGMPRNPADSAGSGTGRGVNMGWAMASARRRMFRQAMQNTSLMRMRHGVVHAPEITHARDGRGLPKFGTGGGFKAGGF